MKCRSRPLRQRVHHAVVLLVISLATPQAAAQHSGALDPAVGIYEASGVDTVVRLQISQSGSFSFVLIAGSLDQRAGGIWKRRGNAIVFTSDPKPIPPVVVLGPITQRADGPFLIRIVGPSGSDLQGLDFTINFDRGEPIKGHSQGAPWAFPDGEQRQPRYISFVMPEYSLNSVELPLSRKAGATATFLFRPNDFGTLDFTGLTARLDLNSLEVCGEPFRAMGDECQTFRRIEP